MDNDDTVCLSAAAPASAGITATPSGCPRSPAIPFAIVDQVWRRLLRAPPWTYAVLVGIGLAAAVLLALR